MNSKNKKILIIEDDATLSLMYKVKFETDGFIVLTADNGALGVEMAKEEKPDLILLDVILPQLDGFSVLEEIKRNAGTKNIPVAMLTSLGTTEDQEKGIKMGAVDYIIKASLTPAELSEKVSSILNK